MTSGFRYQEQITLTDEQFVNLRLDRFLQEFTKDSPHALSRSKAQELIQKQLVLVNGLAAKPSTKLKIEDEIKIQIPEPEDTRLQTYDLPLKILFEDDFCIVVHKPPGLVVHPAAGHSQDTLVNALLHKVKDLSIGFGEKRPGIVHRLDKDTSGILVVAKNDVALENLSAQFKAKTVHRLYYALVYGKPLKTHGTIESLLERHPVHRKKFRSGPRGKRAVTHFRFLAESRGISMIECKLETGRTHQIRVHLSENNLPIIGDPIYSHPRRLKALSGELAEEIKNLSGIGLHAFELGFAHPHSGEFLTFHESWPPHLKPLIEKLGFENVR